MSGSNEVFQAIFEDVKAVVVVTLAIEDRAADLGPETGLYGNFAELDSLAVVKLIVALQSRFGIQIELREIVGDVFLTLGGLAAFVESKLNEPGSPDWGQSGPGRSTKLVADRPNRP